MHDISSSSWVVFCRFCGVQILLRMTKGTLCIFFFTIVVGMGTTFLNEEENAIVSDLISQMEIRFCIFWTDATEIYHLRRISGNNVATTQLNTDRLVLFLDSSESNTIFNTAIVFKEKNLNLFEGLTQKYDYANASYIMSRFTWLIFLDNSMDNIFRYDLRIPLDSELIVVQPVEDHLYKLTELYQVKNKSFSFEFGTWCGALNITNITFYWRRLNLNGSIISILQPVDEFSEERREWCLGNLNTWYCQFQFLLTDFSEMMNFVIRGNMFKSKTGNDIEYDNEFFEQFYRDKDLDMLFRLTALDNTGFEEQFMIGPLYLSSFNWVIKYPETKLRKDYYLQPFETDLWLAIISSLLIGSCFILLLEKRNKSKERSCVDNFFLAFELFCNQNGNDRMEKVTLKMAWLSMSIVGMLIINAFGAAITTFLSVKMPKVPFTDFEQFLDNEQYLLATDEINYMPYSFSANSPQSLRVERLLKNRRVTYSVSYFFDNLGEIVCSNGSLAVSFYEYFDDEDFPCRVFRIPKPISSTYDVIPLQLYSPFKNTFYHSFLRFYEYGLQKKIEKTLYPQPHAVKKIEDFTPIEFEQMAQVLSIPFLGVVLASVFLLIEILCEL